MSRDFQKVMSLYHQALSIPVAERVKFLESVRREDEELSLEVERLLNSQSNTSGLTDVPDVEAAALKPAWGHDRELAGRRLGPFEIVSLLGKGGMGEVYLARDTRLERKVAVKVLPPELVKNAERMKRFEKEAQSVSRLNHSNIITLHDIDRAEGIDYLVMEYVAGKSLDELISPDGMPITTVLPLAIQIAEALTAAHSAGVVHRDLKPGNVMVTEAGQVKVLDFGLAKLVETAEDASAATARFSRTEAGTIVGTLRYMSPEQLQGLNVDHRTDLFSFGVVLYEMVTGELAFSGSSPMAVAGAILNDPPRDFGDSPVPSKLKSIVRKLLEKDPAKRYESAAEVHRELKALEASLAPVRPVSLSRNAWIAVGSAVVLITVLAGWLWQKSSRERWVLETAIPEIERLCDQADYGKAAALVREAREVLPQDPKLEKLWMRVTGEASIDSDPPGAEVSVRPYRGDPNAWETVGTTPFEKIRVPSEAYVWRFVKPGFAPIFVVLQIGNDAQPGVRYGFNWKPRLRPEETVPPEMVAVSGGLAGLGYPLEGAPAVKIDGFLIDRHEVTNQEYKEFVDAGGYLKRDFWKQPFVSGGGVVLWEEAVLRFQDATGRPGPATWEVGQYPDGHEDYPVAGVSWYEAAAYAEFVGKSLPTAYHWTRASQALGDTALIASGSNFRPDGPQPVGGEGTLSGSGTTDMAGNVKEWCWNETRGERRLILGGGFGEPNYMFRQADSQSPWERRSNYGFRCVKTDSPPSSEAMALVEPASPLRDYSSEKPVSDDTFRVFASLYAYDKSDLNAEAEEVATLQNCSLTKVTFDAAYGGERVTAYLFLPKNATPPFQTVIYFPGAFAFLEDSLELSSVDDSLDFILKSGRALIIPAFKGTYERQDGFFRDEFQPLSVRDHLIMWSKDLGRTLDYLETRGDIDSRELAYFGLSAGATCGPVLLAIEKRIRTAILSSGGLPFIPPRPPEGEPFNFAPHVTIPVLMLNGRYDATYPLESSQLPLFRTLGTPAKDKKHVIYEDGHGAFPRPHAVRECLDWLDKYLGPVRR